MNDDLQIDKSIVKKVEALLLDDFINGRLDRERRLKAENIALKKRLKRTKIFCWILVSIIISFISLATISFDSVEVIKEVPKPKFQRMAY